jgi:hypothetical protein
MKYLHKYVPSKQSGAPFNIICHGDQLSVERMVDAKLAMAASEHPSDKLEGLVPRPQNFHKQCIVMQVFNSVKESKAKQHSHPLKNAWIVL